MITRRTLRLTFVGVSWCAGRRHEEKGATEKTLRDVFAALRGTFVMAEDAEPPMFSFIERSIPFNLLEQSKGSS